MDGLAGENRAETRIVGMNKRSVSDFYEVLFSAGYSNHSNGAFIKGVYLVHIFAYDPSTCLVCISTDYGKRILFDGVVDYDAFIVELAKLELR